MIDNFNNLLNNIDLNLTDSTLNMFDLLYHRLIEENEKYNLTSITDELNVYLLHFYDSVTAHFLIPQNATLCDVGSGGGFPAIPLKIVRPDIDLTMIDSVNKKVKYLNETCTLFNFQNAVAIHSRIEDFCATNRETFDVVTSRAVAKLPTLLEYCLPLVKVGGIFIAYKTELENELDSAKKALSVLGGQVEKICDVSLKEQGITRNLLVVKKIKNTPKQYPRGKNQERLSPL